MALKIKRGNSVNLSGVTLQAGEPAFTLDDGKFYIGNGSEKVLINKDFPTNVDTATKLQTGRTISISGDAIGSTTFDGSQNSTINIVLANSGVTQGTYTKLTVDAKGRVTSATNLTLSDLPNITISKISDAGTAASKNVGTASGNIPVLGSNGKLDASVLPAIAISETFVVGSQSEMLGLTAQTGDVAVRTDINKSFILRGSSASSLSNWQELLTPTSPVQSVAGKTGAVVLNSSDVGLGNVTNESKATMFTSPSFTGTPVAPTASAGTNTTQVATTAFVTTAVSNKTSVSGNAGTATKLQTARKITMAGDLSGSVTFDGSSDVTITATIGDIDGGTF